LRGWDRVVWCPKLLSRPSSAFLGIFRMTKKRKSRGRSKGGKGSSGFISCSNCGAHVPRDKAKKVTTRLSMVEPLLARELRAAGAYIAAPITVRYYCISCSVHYGIVNVRAKSERHNKF
jgi:small subunit ribosomal protein S26e